ncbi:heme oxygenase (biliverdin-producing) [Rhodopila sp.]|uniref:biliverdin-producing heme oxygenase n=1 Tax=Rhodopila sp. TaxID=2480087 RepID=UPI003D0B586F
MDSLVHRLRARTMELHRQAERSGVVAALLRGRVSVAAYAVYLRNLLPAYQAMEQALRHRRNQPLLAELALPALYRAEAIVADLGHLAGPGWAVSVPLLPSGQRYADRLTWAASGDGMMLIAHCYTRYLGDLSGGQILGRRLASLFGADFPALAFTHFSNIGNVRAFAAIYRAALDRTGAWLADATPVVEEAAVAFQNNIDISNDIDGDQASFAEIPAA